MLCGKQASLPFCLLPTHPPAFFTYTTTERPPSDDYLKAKDARRPNRLPTESQGLGFGIGSPPLVSSPQASLLATTPGSSPLRDAQRQSQDASRCNTMGIWTLQYSAV